MPDVSISELRILLRSIQLVLCSSLLFSQTPTARTLEGFVYDQHWSIIKGAEVRLIDQVTCHVQTGITDVNGHYAFTDLAFSKFSLTIDQPGFERAYTFVFTLDLTPQVRKHFLRSGPQDLLGYADDCPERRLKGHFVKSAHRQFMVGPEYPADLKRSRTQGEVVFEAVLTRHGELSMLRALKSPDAALTAAAERAVQQWTYTPTMLDGTPVDIIFQPVVNFVLH